MIYEIVKYMHWILGLNCFDISMLRAYDYNWYSWIVHYMIYAETYGRSIFHYGYVWISDQPSLRGF
jgi:hypothetical protein